MKRILYILFSLFLIGCSAQKKSKRSNGEDILSLNGHWKFHAIYGEGSNYMNIQENKDDIIIDNDDTDLVEITGEWKVINTIKKGATFYGENYLTHNFKNEGDTASVKYAPQLKKQATSKLLLGFLMLHTLLHK